MFITRSRLVSSLTFGTAAALVALMLMLEGASRGDWWVMLAMAVPAVLVGALAGPRVAEARTAWIAALWGVGVTLASIALYVGAVALWTTLGLEDGETINRISWSLLALTAILGSAVASPIGALAGVLVRRWAQT